MQSTFNRFQNFAESVLARARQILQRGRQWIANSSCMLRLTVPLRTLVGSSHTCDVAVDTNDLMIDQHFFVQRRLVASCDNATVVSKPTSDQTVQPLFLCSALPNGTAGCEEVWKRSVPANRPDTGPGGALGWNGKS